MVFQEALGCPEDGNSAPGNLTKEKMAEITDKFM